MYAPFISGHHCCNVFLHTRKQLLTRRAFTIFTHKPPLRRLRVPNQRMAAQRGSNILSKFYKFVSCIKIKGSFRRIQVHGLHLIFRHKRIIVLCNQLIKVGALFELIRVDRRADLESIFISLAQRGNALIVTRQIIGDIFRDARVIILIGHTVVRLYFPLGIGAGRCLFSVLLS